MPKKTVETEFTTVASSQGTDHISTVSSGNSISGSVISASDVNSSNNLGGFIGENVQSNLDSLSSEAKKNQPPLMGQEPVTFQNQSGASITHDGRPDWGSAKLLDTPPWISRNKVWAEKREMPHIGFGHREDAVTFTDFKWVNEGGVYDTVTLNYGDHDELSYHDRYASFTHVEYPQITQAVPRAAFSNVEARYIYPFYYRESAFGSELRSDFFNSGTGVTLGMSAGRARSSFGVKSSQPSIALSPSRTQPYQPEISRALFSVPNVNDVGLVISGILFPADRGVVALIRFPSDADSVSAGINTPAADYNDVLSRVVAAINLGQGVGQNDGLPGGSIFNTSEEAGFPSLRSGQYDLYELHTGNYVRGSSRTGANPNLTADHTIGQVRLLSDPLAFNVEDNLYAQGIPVLFSPYEYSTTNGTRSLEVDRNFLSYRLPVLEDYSPDGIVTPKEERDRFFVKNIPNLDQENPNYETLFSTAGGFVTFGAKDNYSYQVARYRHVVNLMDLAPDTYPNIARLQDTPEYNFGSFALLHFKTEAAFERLVRDGIAPSDEELYSQNLLDYSNIAENIRVDLGTVGGDGIEDGENSYAPAKGLSLFRPNVCFEKASFSDRPLNAVISPNVKTDYLYPNYDAANSTKINRVNSYFSFISGVIYISPTMPFVYEGHPDEDGNALDLTTEESKYSKIEHLITIQDPAGSIEMVHWADSRPSKLATVRPHTQILSSSLTAQDNLEASESTDVVNDFASVGQSIWVEGGPLVIDTEIYAKGDAVRPVTDLTTQDPKDGFCTLSTSATRTSILINNPHRQWTNLGVDVVTDDIGIPIGNPNPINNNSKVLYHSARKISLLELYGSRFSPSGTTLGGTPISSLSDIYSAYGDDGYPGGSDESFLYGYLFAWWQNTTADASQDYNPKTAGQSFSVYRYDEEGYKVYQKLDLLPIGGDVANGYALELCSGWKRVDENGNDVNTSSTFKYPQDRPVYRPTENNFERTSATSHADAKLLMVKDVDYYIECYPSVPFTSGLGPDPSTYDETTANQTIFTLGGSAYSDIQLIIGEEENPAQDVWVGYLGTNGLYSNLGAVNNNQCQWLGVDLDPTQAPYNVDPQADLGNTSHVRGIIYLRSSSSFSYEGAKPHPHPQPSVDYNGYINYGIPFLEVAPTGNMEVPEYGNFTQDVRGYITVSGLGNESFYTEDQIHAVAPVYNSRMPLKSLFTLRKDTQERFLDESYRIESSLYHLLLTPEVPTSTARYSNTTAGNSYDPSYLFGGNNFLVENLQGPGLPRGGSGVNNGYICIPVRDETTISPELFTQLRDSDPADDLFRRTAGHGGAGYLRNNWHIRRARMTSDLVEKDWREAQVIGFPDMTRNLLSGSKYGTPPRGILVYPHLDFDGNSPFTIEGQTVGSNNLISSNEGYFLPNAGKGSTDAREGVDWLDDDGDNGGVSLKPKLRHAQPNYNKATLLSDFPEPNEYPDVGYLRAFDVNFGKNPSLTPQRPYWNQDWKEATSTGSVYRGYQEAQNYGQIESKQWVRVSQDSNGELEFAPVKLRLVGVDWNMISFTDTEYPLQKRDGMVHEVDGGYYLVRKRVMRVFVKVPGLTTWLDVGVFDNQVGESYRQWKGDKTDPNVGFADPNGATSLKDSTELDGAGCCISYSEGFLPDEGLVCLDLDLNLGMIPSFNSWGADENSAIGYDSNLVSDDYLGFIKNLRVDNCPSDRLYLHRQANKSARDVSVNGAKNFEAPILVKVILSHPEHPKYEVHPDDSTKLVNSTDIDDLTLEIADLANATPNNVTIVDIHPSPNTSYLGHSYPPDDRSPLWARRGLMGIEVLRQDGSNYDRDRVIPRPDYTSIDLYGNPTLYYGRTEDGLVYETYEKSSSALTNKRTYTHGSNVSPAELSSDYKKPVKGEG